MPVAFLTDEQARRYGRYSGDPTPSQLARHFYLDDRDHNEIGLHRGDDNRLGYYAVLCAAVVYGSFPEHVSTGSIAIPTVVVNHLAQQLLLGP